MLKERTTYATPCCILRVSRVGERDSRLGTVSDLKSEESAQISLAGVNRTKAEYQGLVGVKILSLRKT